MPDLEFAGRDFEEELEGGHAAGEEVGVLFPLDQEFEVGELLRGWREDGGADEQDGEGREGQVQQPARLAQQAEEVERDDGAAQEREDDQRKPVGTDHAGEPEGEPPEAARVAEEDFVEAPEDPGHEGEDEELAQRGAGEQVRREVAAPRVEEGGGEGAEVRRGQFPRAEVGAEGGQEHPGGDEAFVGGDDAHAAEHEEGPGVEEDVRVEEAGGVAVVGDGPVVDHGGDFAEPEVLAHGVDAGEMVVHVVAGGDARQQEHGQAGEHERREQQRVEASGCQAGADGGDAGLEEIDRVHGHAFRWKPRHHTRPAARWQSKLANLHSGVDGLDSPA